MTSSAITRLLLVVLVRRTTKQPQLTAVVQARHLSQFGHIAQMPDETDAKKILTASPWRTGGDH